MRIDAMFAQAYKQNKRRILMSKKDSYIKKKKNMNFKSVDSMQTVVNVVNEAAVALNDKNRTVKESAIPEVLAGALGAGIGGVGSCQHSMVLELQGCLRQVLHQVLQLQVPLLEAVW